MDTEWVYLDPNAALWLDVRIFEQVFANAKGLCGEGMSGPHIQTLQFAVDLYQGGLLQGYYWNWRLLEREPLEQMYLTMLDKLIDQCEKHGEYENALVHAMRILSIDRAHERTHYRLMRLHYLAGNRTAALRQFSRCATALDEELGVPPSTQTVRLFEHIKADLPLNVNEETQLMADEHSVPATTKSQLAAALVGAGVAPPPPLAPGRDQRAPLLRPAPDAPGSAAAIIPADRLGARGEPGGRLLSQQRTFGRAASGALHPSGPPRPGADQGQPLARDPARVAAFAPTGILVQLAQLLRYGALGCGQPDARRGHAP